MRRLRKLRRTIRCRMKYGRGGCPHVERHSPGHPPPQEQTMPLATRHREGRPGVQD